MTDVQPEVEPTETVEPDPDPAAGATPASESTSEPESTSQEEATGVASAPESTPEEPESTSEDNSPGTTPTPVGATFRVMDVEDVRLELPSQYPSVTLIEAEPPMRELVFPIGLPEGNALALALRRMDGRRPLTHELFMQVLQRAHIDVIAVRLIGREEGNLLAELDLMTPAGRECVDCRPSDGLVLALRMPVPAPILVDERLLESLGDVAPVPKPTEP